MKLKSYTPEYLFKDLLNKSSFDISFIQKFIRYLKHIFYFTY